ncbi:GAF domain-containing protein [Paenibacillus turpanensis]|uniref:GAF domain-containing protein n=1 Tax=Paenibacillus turpanensis TaxID=2689078 RepID=UPI00140CBA36|nr:GAF domain-containing protein [Paenibacillus turpanensis]
MPRDEGTGGDGKRTQAFSTLCVPIMEEERLCGLLYVENKLLPGVFAADRLGVMRMGAMQLYYAMQLETTHQGRNRLLPGNLDIASL